MKRARISLAGRRYPVGPSDPSVGTGIARRIASLSGVAVALCAPGNSKRGLGTGDSAGNGDDPVHTGAGSFLSQQTSREDRS